MDGNVGAYRVYWDSKEKKRVMYENEFTHEMNVVWNETLLSEEWDACYNKAMIFFIPYYNYDIESELDICSNYYNISEEKNIEVHGGSLTYYLLEKK